MIVPADKTANFYKISKEEYINLRNKDIQKSYKKENMGNFEKVNDGHKKLAENLCIDDRLFKTVQQDAFWHMC